MPDNALLLGIIVPMIDDFPLELAAFLYLGPDTILPLTSICAGLIGFVLIFWRFFLGLGRRFYQRIIPSATRQDEQNDESLNHNEDK